MQRALILYAAAVTAACLWLGLRSAADAGDEPTTTINGDVDCDGRLTVVDAVGILRYMFADGPEPCGVEPEVVVRLPVPAKDPGTCRSEGCPSCDSEVPVESVPLDPILASPGTLYDPALGLEWRRALEPGSYTWCGAQEIAGDGPGDFWEGGAHGLIPGVWRLPTVYEALSLYDFSSRSLRDEGFDWPDHIRIWTSTWEAQEVGGDPIVAAIGTSAARFYTAPTGSLFDVLLVREVQP